MNLQTLFESVRESASRREWSRGVELARANAVRAERIDAREAQLRVAEAGRPVARLVTLLLDADAWSCDCPGPEDPCEHVAAAVIALRRAREAGHELPSAQQSGAGRSVTGGQDGRSTAWNDAGQIAATMIFSDNTRGVFRLTVPEPASGAAACVGIAALVAFARRHARS